MVSRPLHAGCPRVSLKKQMPSSVVLARRRERKGAEDELQAIRTKVKSMERAEERAARATSAAARQLKAIRAAKSQKAMDSLRRERFRLQKAKLVRERHRQLVLYRDETHAQREARERAITFEKKEVVQDAKARKRESAAASNMMCTQRVHEARLKRSQVREKLQSAATARVQQMSASQTRSVQRNMRRYEQESRRVLAMQKELERARAEEVELARTLRELEGVREACYRGLQEALRASQ